MPYEVSQLLQNLGAPVSASPEEPVRIAVDRMLGKGFSQLPVVKGTGPQAQFYLITHESILMALHRLVRLRENTLPVAVVKPSHCPPTSFALLTPSRYQR